MKEKKLEWSVVKWPRNPMVNVVAALQQCCGSVLIPSGIDVVLTSDRILVNRISPFSCLNVLFHRIKSQNWGLGFWRGSIMSYGHSENI